MLATDGPNPGPAVELTTVPAQLWPLRLGAASADGAVATTVAAASPQTVARRGTDTGTGHLRDMGFEGQRPRGAVNMSLPSCAPPSLSVDSADVEPRGGCG